METKIFLLDRSGSMDACRADTIGGFNSFINDQKQFGGRMTLVQFDNEMEEVFSEVPIDEVRPLTTETFQPRGSTALLDAIGKTIKKYADTQRVAFIILTDGEENSSHQFTKAHVKDLIEQKTKDGWTFVYLGANQDAFAEAGSIGIGSATTMNYDVRRTPEAFRALSATLSSQNSNIM